MTPGRRTREEEPCDLAKESEGRGYLVTPGRRAREEEPRIKEGEGKGGKRIHVNSGGRGEEG